MDRPGGGPPVGLTFFTRRQTWWPWMERLYMEAQESTRSTTATEGRGVRPGQPLAAGDSHRCGKRAEPSVGMSSLTGKMVVKTDLCQKVLEGHTNAINLD